jgi:hypothetical protein
VSRDWTEQSAATCGVGREGIQRAVIAWAVPLTAVALLVLGLRDSLLKVFNILVVAFGTTALVRSGRTSAASVAAAWADTSQSARSSTSPLLYL